MFYYYKKISIYNNNYIYLVFVLRITPIIPNSAVNFIAPIVKIPVKEFVIGTFFGILPASFMHVIAGKQLSRFSSFSDGFNFKSVIILSILSAFLIILPKLIFKTK